MLFKHKKILCMYILSKTIIPFVLTIILFCVLPFSKIISEEVETLLLNLISQVIVLIYIIKYMSGDLVQDIKKTLKKKKVLLKILIYVMLMYIIPILIGLSLVFLLKVNICDTSNQQVVEAIVIESTIMGAASVLLAPLEEEIVFRHIIMEYYLEKSVKKAIILSSLLFAGAHILVSFNIGECILYLILGLYLGWVYYKEKSITMVCGIHFVKNLIGVLAILFWS